MSSLRVGNHGSFKNPGHRLAMNSIQGKRGEYPANMVDDPGPYRLILRSVKLVVELFTEVEGGGNG